MKFTVTRGNDTVSASGCALALVESTISRCGAPLLRAREASTFLSRLRGLHATGPLGPHDALIIRPCRAVHTYRLGYPIDVVFLDSYGAIIEIKTLSVGCVAWCRRARVVIEMAAGTGARLRFGPGQVLVSSSGAWT